MAVHLLGGKNMKLKTLVASVLMAFAGTALAQAPAPGTVKADRAAVKADERAVKADVKQMRADRKAGNKDAVAADQAKLKADREQLKAHRAKTRPHPKAPNKAKAKPMERKGGAKNEREKEVEDKAARNKTDRQ